MPDACTELPDLDDTAYQSALAIVLDVGTSLVQELKAPSPDQTPVQRAHAFPNLATAIRRTIILSRDIAKTPQSKTAPERHRATARKDIIRSVEDTIDQKADPADTGALRIELLERVDQPEFDADLAHRSRADLIQELCRDLGLANRPFIASFARRTPDDIAILCAQAAAPAGAGLPTWLTPTETSDAPTNKGTAGPPKPPPRCPPS